jgi:hypothetical protein
MYKTALYKYEMVLYMYKTAPYRPTMAADRSPFIRDMSVAVPALAPEAVAPVVGAGAIYTKYIYIAGWGRRRM